MFKSIKASLIFLSSYMMILINKKVKSLIIIDKINTNPHFHKDSYDFETW